MALHQTKFLEHRFSIAQNPRDCHISCPLLKTILINQSLTKL